MHDLGANLLQELVQRIDILVLTSSEGDVVETDARLHEAFPGVLWIAATNAEGSATAHAIVEALSVEDGFETESREQLLVEGTGAFEVARCEHDMGDTVDVVGHGSSILLTRLWPAGCR